MEKFSFYSWRGQREGHRQIPFPQRGQSKLATALPSETQMLQYRQSQTSPTTLRPCSQPVESSEDLSLSVGKELNGKISPTGTSTTEEAALQEILQERKGSGLAQEHIF